MVAQYKNSSGSSREPMRTLSEEIDTIVYDGEDRPYSNCEKQYEASKGMASIMPKKTKAIGGIGRCLMPKQDSLDESIKQVPTLCNFKELGKWLIVGRYTYVYKLVEDPTETRGTDQTLVHVYVLQEDCYEAHNSISMLRVPMVGTHSWKRSKQETVTLVGPMTLEESLQIRNNRLSTPVTVLGIHSHSKTSKCMIMYNYPRPGVQ